MAVDIYCYSEHRVDSDWLFNGKLVPNEEHKYDPEASPLAPESLLHSVHKELAAILVDTGRPIRSLRPYTPIVARRGRPTDLSSILREHFAYYNYDDAMVYSWFTGQEFVDFDMTSHFMTRQAYVDPSLAHLFQNGQIGFPFDRWPASMPIRYAEWSRDGVQVQWDESYASIVKDFSNLMSQYLSQFAKLNDVRIIVQAGW